MNKNFKKQMQDIKHQKGQADIVILGGGGGGLTAAVAAAEKGIENIIIVEKAGHLGGNSAMAHGLFACESPVQKRNMIDCRSDDCFKTAMRWAHWSRVNPLVVRAFFDKSGDTIKWLEKKGIEFELRMMYPNQLAVWHNPVGLGAKLIKTLAKECDEIGVKILLYTSGKKIILDKPGKISGVLIADANGNESEIKARSVILSTGGFNGNPELLEKYCPVYHETMRLHGIPLNGDGIIMAEDAGIAVADTVPLLKGGPGPDIEFSKSGSLAAIVKEPYLILVNKKGKRFVDETTSFTWESVNAALHQPGKITYALFDDRIRKNMEEEGLLIGHGRGKKELEQRKGIASLQNEIQQKMSETNGQLVSISDSWEEIAKWIGADPSVLRNTIDTYNSFCDHGRDKVFAKDPKYLIPLRDPPYYAIRCSTGYHDTMGGIKVNENMETLNTKDEVVPGLYTAGVLADGWAPDNYWGVLCGSAFGFAINSGRIAGENSAEFVHNYK